MRRADRLFQIVQMLRGGRLVTAKKLSGQLEVSERTIYRDIGDLQSSGVPIDGEAGVGYVMRGGYDIPPLMFNRDEIVALVVGARMVRAWGGLAMARAAEEALMKIEAVVPEGERERISNTKVFAPPLEMTEALRLLVDDIEKAVEDRRILSFSYTDEKGAASARSVHPLGLWFWGKVWTLVGWCELRDDFRMFRLDRMADIAIEKQRFKPAPERSITEFFRQLDREGCEIDP